MVERNRKFHRFSSSPSSKFSLPFKFLQLVTSQSGSNLIYQFNLNH